MAPSSCPSCHRSFGSKAGGCGCPDGLYWSLMAQAPKPVQTRTASAARPLPDLDPMLLVSQAGRAEMRGAQSLPARLAPPPVVDLESLTEPHSDYGIEFDAMDIDMGADRPGRGSSPRFRVDRPMTTARYEGSTQRLDGEVVGNVREPMGRPGRSIAEVRAAATRPAPPPSRPAPPVDRSRLPSAYDHIGSYDPSDDPFS